MANRLPITTYGMEVLRKKTSKIKSVDIDLISLAEDMFFTMKNANGVGLAAPQVNMKLSLAVVDISCIEEYKDVKPVTLINPVIIDSHGESVFEEGCLSIPNIRAEIVRPDKIYIKYNDFDMNEIYMEMEGFLSRVTQHEIDHLNGKLFIDYLSKDKLNEFKEMLKKIQNGETDTDYPTHINADKFYGY